MRREPERASNCRTSQHPTDFVTELFICCPFPVDDFQRMLMQEVNFNVVGTFKHVNHHWGGNCNCAESKLQTNTASSMRDLGWSTESLSLEDIQSQFQAVGSPQTRLYSLAEINSPDISWQINSFQLPLGKSPATAAQQPVFTAVVTEFGLHKPGPVVDQDRKVVPEAEDQLRSMAPQIGSNPYTMIHDDFGWGNC